jgi:hypothetical protein
LLLKLHLVYIDNLRTLSANITFIWTSFILYTRRKANVSALFRRECKYILYLLTMYVYCVYAAMSKCPKHLPNFPENWRHRCCSNRVKLCPRDYHALRLKSVITASWKLDYLEQSSNPLFHYQFVYYVMVLFDKINVREYWRGNKKMDNPEKLATYGTQDVDKRNKNTTQYVLKTTMRKQTQITWIRHEPPTNIWR